MKKVMVIGAGQMGSGIAQVCATAGYDVILNDINEERVQWGLNNIAKASIDLLKSVSQLQNNKALLLN
ncbi:3-hydroxyacyl-CoA dehydrogenase NAD-binding domain-containing protein [Anoxybacillus kestanbolensis]|uniref:3-hydroxyacyl-CoA dehydrogenase NAD-binding domain-containing protein n=1 Tax=Anoxybacillus kestanbolensis TaxID=227476 RepID=UPI003D1E95F3